MQALSLIIEKISENDENFDFSRENKNFRIKDAELIKNGILLALYGDENLSSGKITYTFLVDNDKYKLIRNFDDKVISLQKNDDTEITAVEEINQFIKTTVNFNKADYENLILTNINSEDSPFMSNPIAFIDNMLNDYQITDDIIADKQLFYKTEVTKISTEIDYLEKLKKSNSCSDSTIKELRNDISNINKDLEELNKSLFKAEEIMLTEKSIKELKEKLRIAKTSQNDEVDYGQLLENSDKIENTIFLIKKNAEVNKINNELEAEITTLSEMKNNAEVDIDKDYTALKNLENEYSDAKNKILEVKENFAPFIQEGLDTENTDSEYNVTLAKYYADTDKQIDVLQAQKSILENEYNKILSDIDENSALLSDTIYSSAKKKALREGMVLETIVSEKEKYLLIINKEISDNQARLDYLYSVISTNENIINDAKLKTKTELGEEYTLAALYEQLNNDELTKQTLYRNQIRIVNVDREIKAIDNKIYENEEGLRSFEEDFIALDNAKKTLLGYISKLDEKVEDIAHKQISIMAKKQYLDNIDAAQYGDKCPVCNGLLLDKNDFSKENLNINKAFADIINEKHKAALIRNDYALQLEKINIRLGELTSRTHTSRIYLESLHETKDAKVGLVKKLLSSSGVRTFEELNGVLEDAIKKVAYTSQVIAVFSNFSTIENFSMKAITSAKEEISNIKKVILPQAIKLQKEQNSVIADCKHKLELSASIIGETSAIMQSPEIVKKETKQDILNAKLLTLQNKKIELRTQIDQLNDKINSLICRDSSVLIEVNGKSCTYSQVVISIAQNRYSEFYSILNDLESEKEAIQNKYMALVEEIKSKKESLFEVSKTLSMLLNKKESNLEMLSFLNENASFTPDEYKDANIDELQNQILNEEQKIEMKEKLSLSTDGFDLFDYQIKTLEKIVADGKIYLDNYEENTSAKKTLLSMINEKQALVNKELNTSALLSYLSENIDMLNIKNKSFAEYAKIFDGLKNNKAQFLIEKTSALLKNISNGKYGLVKENDTTNIINLKNKGTVIASPTPDAVLLAEISAIGAVCSLAKEMFSKSTLRLLSLNTVILKDYDFSSILNIVSAWDMLLLPNE
jgi:DNA repair exonuclease SbcCD ATPase subunit